MSEQKYITCIICPRGCRLTVTLEDSAVLVTGHACPRGEVYGRQEAIEPLRSLTTTVKTSSNRRPRLPVHSDKDLPLRQLLDAMAALDSVLIDRKVECGEVVYKNILDLGVNILASDSFDPESHHG